MHADTLVRLALVAIPMAVQAQSLADRVGAVSDDVVTFHFTPRPGVCGDGESYVRTGRSSYHGSFSTHRSMEPCRIGPVQVRLMVSDGAIDRVQFWVGPLRARDARDLGAVPAAEGARYLMSLAARGSSRVSAKAILPAVLADSATVWPELLAVARDLDRPRATRQEAILFLSRFASGAVAGRPNDPFGLEDDEGSENDDLKTHAVFVLSQLPRGESVPALLEIARSNADRRVRSQAFFWVGQSGDPRAIDLFEAELRAKTPRLVPPGSVR